MSDSITVSQSDELQPLFENAGNRDAESIKTLTAVLQNAAVASSDELAPTVATNWQNGLAPFAKAMTPATLDETSGNLITAMLKIGLDTATFRDLYKMYAAHCFATYEDQDGLVNALGLTQEDVKISHIAQKWAVMQAIVSNSRFCYQRALGIAEITAVDSIGNNVRITISHKAGEKDKDVRHLNIPLRSFLENAIIVLNDTDADRWLKDRKLPAGFKMAAADLEKLVRSNVVSATVLPMNMTRALFVPSILTDAKLKGITTITPGATAAAAQATETQQTVHWETSRSILELSERLKTVTDFSTADVNGLANVNTILKNASVREADAIVFAMSLSILQEHSGCYPEWLNDTICGDLAEQAVVWKNDELFAETSDKLPVKLIPAWFQATYKAKGAQYLVEHTFILPFKLWAHAERLLSTTQDADLFHAMAADKLKEGKTSADMLYWVWKSKYEDLQQTYLTNAPLIFKTLMKEVKGSYLKAQRDIHRMLLSDAKFQRQVMNNGAQNAVESLVRCAKRMTLLDASERQSLLVQIVRLYPEFLSIVEDHKPTQMTVSLPPVSSIRSIKSRQQELEHLINKLIPENTKAIEVAREHGDLKENSEYKFAKERQRFLGTRRTEFERSLTNIRATDFRSVEINGMVVPGCSVVVRVVTTGKEETFHILGLLDTFPEKNIIAFDTPLGKVLVGHKTGEHVTLPQGDTAIIREVKKLSPELLAWVSSDPDPIVDEPDTNEQ